MHQALLALDRVARRIGQAFAWAIVLLVLAVAWDIVARTLFGRTPNWTPDVQRLLFAVAFLMAGAYTLERGGHLRGDALYGFLQPRSQAAFDLALYLLFYLPGVIGLTWAGWHLFTESLALGERSTQAAMLPVWPFKVLVPLAGGVLLLQGCAEIARCTLCLRDGAWPARAHDTEEIDFERLRRRAQGVEADAPLAAPPAGEGTL